MGATPLWFTEILSRLQIYPTSFSKYGNVYRTETADFDYMDLMQHRLENWKTEGPADIYPFTRFGQTALPGMRA